MAARTRKAKAEVLAAPKPARRSKAKAAEPEVVDAEVVKVSGPAQAPLEADPGTEVEAEEPSDDEIEAELGEEEDASLAVAEPEARIARRDPLSAYMAEVTKHPLLTRDEEVALARTFRDTGDVKAAYRLVASNLRLVVKLAHEYHRNPLSLLDLVQEGNIGLMQAVKKFDPERGVKLSSYAAWWIRAYILRYIMDNWKMVKLGTTEAQRKLFFKLRQEQDRLTTQGFEVTPKLLAERLAVSEQDVIEMDQRLGQDELSIDAPMPGDDDGKTSRADRLLPSGAAGAEENLGNAELKSLFQERLDEFRQTLNEKEKLLVEQRLLSDEPKTLQEIGAGWGVSRERARQIEAALIAKLRAYMREKIPDFELLARDDD